MTHSQYLQYSALNRQLTNLHEIAAFIKAKVPTQLGEKEYDYNRKLTEVIRKDLYKVIEIHTQTIETQMEAL